LREITFGFKESVHNPWFSKQFEEEEKRREEKEKKCSLD
jgi:hypothetical protein